MLGPGLPRRQEMLLPVVVAVDPVAGLPVDAVDELSGGAVLLVVAVHVVLLGEGAVVDEQPAEVVSAELGPTGALVLVAVLMRAVPFAAGLVGPEA